MKMNNFMCYGVMSHNLYCKNLLPPSFWYHMVAAHFTILIVPSTKLHGATHKMSIILDLYCQVCHENYPSVYIKDFYVVTVGLYAGFEICAVQCMYMY